MTDREKDRFIRVREAFGHIADELATLYCIWLEAKADDQAAQASAPIASTPTPIAEPLLTARELEPILNIKEQTLRDWAKKGRIPCVPVNAEIRFRWSAIANWLDERERNQAKENIENTPVLNIESGRSFLRPQNRSKSNGRF